MLENATRPRIAVIDYGIGNLRSAEKAMQKVGADAFLTNQPDEIESAAGVMLPGVGAMGRCIEALNSSGLRAVAVSAAQQAAEGGRPFLGVCVGMQMLHAGSTEHGGVEGLGLFGATVKEIAPISPSGEKLTVPHMQWNQLISNTPNALIDSSNPDRPWVYFVHSFAPEAHADVVATTEYGGPISAIVARQQLMGTQFHPEKSGLHGLAMLRRFVSLCAA
jgi:imidazole glycerol-phosphate synthase subunit HisH